MAVKMLAEERAFYEAHFKEYRRNYAGRYLLIHGSELIGDYEDELEAASEGYRRVWRTGTEDHGYLVVKAGEPAGKTVTAPSVVWMRLAKSSRESKPHLKELLLAPEPRTEELALPRQQFRYRDAPRSGS